MLHAVIYDIETYTYNAVYWLQIKSKNHSKTTFRTINSMHSSKNCTVVPSQLYGRAFGT